jgi:hypothetical protein
MIIAIRVFAGLYGLNALAGSVVLVLFFTLETSMLGGVPHSDVFGPLSDWLGVVGAVPLILATVLLAVLMRARWWFWIVTALLVIATILFAVVSWRFIHGYATLGDQIAAAGPHLALLVAWMVCAGAVGARAGVLPRWMRTFAVVLAITFAVGALLYGIAFAVPLPPGWQQPVMVVGAICGFLAWTVPSGWWICVAVTTRRPIEQTIEQSGVR